jgi:hypothetical protein
VSRADSITNRSDTRSAVVAAEVGSARLEHAEPDAAVVALAEAFTAGEMSEADFDASVERHQQALIADTQQRLFIAGRE